MKTRLQIHRLNILQQTPHRPSLLTLLCTDTVKTLVHTLKCESTSINEPCHSLAVSPHMPRANRWRMFCTHLRWYLSGYCGLESVLWIMLSIYFRVAKLYCCMFVLFNHHGLFMLHILRGSAGCGKLVPWWREPSEGRKTSQQAPTLTTPQISHPQLLSPEP